MLAYYSCASSSRLRRVFVASSSRVRRVFVRVRRVFVASSSRVRRVFVACSSLFVAVFRRVFVAFSSRLRRVFVACSSRVRRVFVASSSRFVASSSPVRVRLRCPVLPSSSSVECLLGYHHMKRVQILIRRSTDTRMRVCWHVGAKLLIINRMLKRDHHNKVLPILQTLLIYLKYFFSIW